MKFRTCYKCGKKKVAKIEPKDKPELDASDIEMTKQGYGKNRGSFFCKDCDEDSNFEGDDE